MEMKITRRSFFLLPLVQSSGFNYCNHLFFYGQGIAFHFQVTLVNYRPVL